jgi:hypothetical protein
MTAFMNPGLIGMISVLGLCVWMLFRPHSNEVPKIFLFMMVSIALGPVCDAVMNVENRMFPLKFDYSLYLIDRGIGISAFSFARLLNEWQRSVLFFIYQSLGWIMIVWYACHLKKRDGRPNQLLIAYAIAYFAGACLYLIVPACGPRHAFQGLFPSGNPDVRPVLLQLNYWPNAIPSLHLATALLFLFFAGNSRALCCIAWVYVAGTAAATLAFEHYFIDLIVAVPFACFCTRAAEGRIGAAIGQLSLVLVWLLGIRYETPELVMHPLVLRLLVLVTVGVTALNMLGGRTSRSGELLQLSPEPSVLR